MVPGTLSELEKAGRDFAQLLIKCQVTKLGFVLFNVVLFKDNLNCTTDIFCFHTTVFFPRLLSLLGEAHVKDETHILLLQVV